MSRKHIKDKRRQELIEANISCIARHGLTDTTIAHVSNAADMSRGIVNFYFTTKEQMMQETLSFLITEYHDFLDNDLQDADDKLVAIINVHFAQKLCNTRRLSVWSAFAAHAASHTAYRKMLVGSHQETIKHIVACGLANSEAEILKAAIDGLWFQFTLVPEAARRDIFAGQCRSLVERLQAKEPVVEAVKEPEKAPKSVVLPVPKAAKPAAKPAPKPTPKKVDELPQLDFGDLFSKNA